MKISIHADTVPVEQYLVRLARRMRDMRPVMNAIGEIIVASVRRNFRESRAPDGTPWKPVKRKGRPLVDSGRLRNSVGYLAGHDRVEVGTGVVYASFHQFGTGPYTIRPRRKKALYWPGAAHPVKQVNHPGLPARPFLMVQDEDWTEIRDAMLEYLMRLGS